MKPQQRGCTAALVALLALVASSFAPTLTLSATTTTTSTFVCTAACAVAAPNDESVRRGKRHQRYSRVRPRTTYEGCSKTLCGEVCANVPTPMTVEPTTMSNRKRFHCFNASDYKYMYMAGTEAAAEIAAVEHSVAE